MSNDISPMKEYTPTLCVQKVWLAIDHQGLNHHKINDEVGLAKQRIYRWLTTSGEPSVGSIIPLARAIDRDVIYLIDDTIPLGEPAPKYTEIGIGGVKAKSEVDLATGGIERVSVLPEELDDAMEQLLSLRQTILELNSDLMHVQFQLKRSKTNRGTERA